jgi:2-polyprenyl-6-hydroxyphenyl methylase/3-demethylubiquinone-9 3-methyltransferase
MFDGLENIIRLVKPQGLLFISVYNDQGLGSKIWHKIKKTYVRYPIVRPYLVTLCGLWIWKYRIIWGTIRYGNPYKFIQEYNQNNRGMSAYYDLIDWVGGYPFEVASPERIFDFLKARNYDLLKLKTCGGQRGCNEYIFSKK